MAHKYHIENNFYENNLQFGDVSLIQLGMMHCNPGDVVPLHMHTDYFELSVVVNGKAEILTNGDSVSVERDDIHVSYPLETHEIRSSVDKPLQYIFCAFKIANRDLLQRLITIKANFQSAASRIIRSQTLAMQVDYALKKLNEPDNLLYNELMTAVLNEIVVLTIVAFYKQDKPKPKITQSEEFCYQIMAYVNENIFNLDSLQSINKEFKYDYAYLSRLFKATTGQTLSSYYQNIRFQMAKSLIERNYKFAEIASMLHFASLYSFSKSFKNFYKISPTAYKKTIPERALFNLRNQTALHFDDKPQTPKK